MTPILLMKLAAAIVGLLIGILLLFRKLRLTQGSLVEGRITYLENKSSWVGRPLLTFSYVAQGRHFHKNWDETLNRSCARKFREVADHGKVGDKIMVWYADADPDMCCIGERLSTKDFIKGWLTERFVELMRLFR